MRAGRAGVHVRDGVAEGVVGDDEGVGVDGDGADGVLADEGGNNTGGKALPDANHTVDGARVEFVGGVVGDGLKAV